MSDGIQTHDLRKTFEVRGKGMFSPKSTRVALDGLTLSIPSGGVTGLLGLNGAGKTTTIKIISTLLSPSSGSVTVDGLEVAKHQKAIRQRINMIAGGERMVYTRMTARENLWYFGQLYNVPRRTLNGRIAHLLDLVGLSDAADRLVETYSRGMVQRLSIARGLINEPRYLLLDEPTLGLDAPIARDLRSVVAELAKEFGCGILLTSHYLQEVEELCDRIYVIARGRHLSEGTPDELKAAAGCMRSVRVTISHATDQIGEAMDAFGRRWEVIPRLDQGINTVEIRHNGDLAGPLVAALVTAGVTIEGLEIKEPTLEDAILALTDVASGDQA